MLIDIAAFVFVIGILVFVHELGHFLLAKKAGVLVEKFSLGFGPKLLGFKRGETEYLICALPLGGYVKMFGEGGEGALIIESVEEDSSAYNSGFRNKDKIVGIEGLDLINFSTWKDLLRRLKVEEDKTYSLTIERDDEQFNMEAKSHNFEGAEIYTEQDYPRSFAKQSLLARFQIIFAGPLMNLIFPFFIMPIVFMIGIAVPAYQEQTPVIGLVVEDSDAAKAGFMAEDVITSVNGTAMENWRDVMIVIGTNPGKNLSVIVEREGISKELFIESPTKPGALGQIGIAFNSAAKVGGVVSGTPAEKAGLKEGDKIVAINGQSVQSWFHMASVINNSADKEISLSVQRGADTLTINLTPQAAEDGGRGVIGIERFFEKTIKKYSFTDSIVEGVKDAGRQVVEYTSILVGFVYKLATGQLSLGAAKHSLAGPIGIAQLSGSAAKLGISYLLTLTVLISINLGIINLFPIPMLDGGHVVYLSIEAIRRKPLSMKSMEIAQRIGFFFLITLMLFAVYNDIDRLNVFGKIAELFK